MTYPIRRFNRSVVCLALLVVARLGAQTAPGLSSPATAPDAAVMLSPFEVSSDRDRGYTALNALTGGRVDTPLKETPAAVSILTRDFLDDIGANNFADAVEWSVNVVGAQPTTTFAEFGTNFRGLSGNSFPTRNYFRWFVNSDSYNIERLELTRGPNSILFGDGNIAGIATTWTKRAKFSPVTQLQTRFDSYGSRRANFDVNRTLGSRLALRAAALADRGESWRDGVKTERDSAFLTATFKLSDTAQLRGNVEAGRYTRPIFSQNFRDTSSNWNRAAVFDGVTAPAAGTGTARLNTGVANDYLVWNASRPQDGVRNWAGFYTTTGSNLNILPDGRPGLAFSNGTPVSNFPALPNREFNLQSADSLAETEYLAAEIFFNQRLFGRLDLELAANRQQVKRDAAEGVWRDHGIDINRVLPGGETNPNFGKAYADVIPSRQTQENNIKDYRLAASYPFETSWMRQRVSIFVGRKLEQFRQDNYSEARLNGPNPDATHATNQIAHRVYWDDANRSARAIPSAPGTLAIGYRRNNLFIEEQDLTYSQVAAAGRYFGGRVSTILGYRRDRFERDAKSRASRDATGYPVLGPSVLTDVTVNTGSAGTVVFPFKSRTLGVYANASETFNAPGSGAALIDGGSPDPSKGKGIDVGLKLDLFEGRIAGSVGYYKTREIGRLVGGPSLGDINEIWLDLGKIENQLVAYRDTQTFQSKGWEVDLTASLAKGWKLLLNYGRPETSQIDTLPGLKSYYAVQIAEWRAGSTNPALPNAARIATNIGDINRALEAANEGRRLNNTVDYTFNVFTDYTLQSGPLKNVSFGGGANVRGKNLVGNVAGQPFNYLHADDYFLVSGKIGYRFKVRETTVRVQVNASNLLDNDDIVVNGYSTFQGRDVPNGFYYLEPRKFVLTATFDF